MKVLVKYLLTWSKRLFFHWFQGFLLSFTQPIHKRYMQDRCVQNIRMVS